MYLFTRNARVLSGGNEIVTDLIALTDFVNRNTELDVSLYSMILGPEPGTISWSTLVTNRSELVDAGDKLAPRDEYWEIVGRVGAHMTPTTDALLTPIHATGDIGQKPDFVSTIWGQAAAPIPAVAGWCIEMADLATSITGAPIVLSANSIGPMGQFGFMSSGSSVDELEERTQTIWADERYMAKLGESDGMFQPGVGGTSTWRKVH